LKPIHWISIGAALLLALVLYFGFSTKAPEQKKLESLRVQNFEQTGIQNLLNEAGDKIDDEAKAVLHALEDEVRKSDSDTAKLPVYEELSSFWYSAGEYAIAGHYAELIAEVVNTEEAWSITGTTFAVALQRASEESTRNFSFKRAVNAFENAISIRPDNPQHKINLALCYTELPPGDNPMKGVQMLLQLQEEYPEYVGTKIALARLAIKTGQMEKAVERLQQARELDPNDKRVACLLADVLNEMGRSEEAATYEIDCLK
jgi:tetratricopeptide (TPR) repeat protein